ncbi:MAG: Uma2 family endonuclease [Planctomycetes bacterium]|nr:Uma2 family endonuclease [Planctomycetota bacterium]
MTTAIALTPPPSEEPPSRLFSVADYHRMIATGILREEDRCELIRGRIVTIMPPNPPHSSVSRRVARNLMPLFSPPEWVFGSNDPITLSDSQPQPYFFAARGPDVRYADLHPGPKDLVLVVEVSDSSLGYDRGTKQELYAEAKVPQYWIVNVSENRVEVYTDPRGGKAPAYKTRTDYGPSDSLPVVVAGKQLGVIAVKELLP